MAIQMEVEKISIRPIIIGDDRRKGKETDRCLLFEDEFMRVSHPPKE